MSKWKPYFSSSDHIELSQLCCQLTLEWLVCNEFLVHSHCNIHIFWWSFLTTNLGIWHTIQVSHEGPHKADVPKSNIATIWIPIFEWCVVRCGSKNGHQINIRIKEVALRDQNVLTILNWVVNVIEKDLYDHLMSTRTFTLIIKKHNSYDYVKALRQLTTNAIWIC